MKAGCIVLANSKKGIVPRLIRLITGSKYSHSLVTMPDCCGAPMCIEAAENGVSFLRFDFGYTQNPDQSIRCYDVNLPEEVKLNALADTLFYLEEGYGFLELPWFMWRAINSFFGRDIKLQNNWSSKGTICSELCVQYLMKCGLEYLFVGFGKGSINAEDLRKIMEANPKIFTVIAER